METDDLEAAFRFGFSLAEYLFGIKRNFRDDVSDRILDTLEKIASGELTLIDTPEEKIAELPGLPESLKKSIPGHLRNARAWHQEVATKLLKGMR